MSCRMSQPARNIMQLAAAIPQIPRARLFIEHLGHMLRVNRLQEPGSLRQIKLGIGGFDAYEKAVRRGVAKPLGIENRVMRLRQPIQRQHAKYGESALSENGQLKRDGNERRPAIQGPAADIHGIANEVYPKLEEKAGQTTSQAAEQCQI